MHMTNIVHRDIKPENIMLTNELFTESALKPGSLKLIDFGLSCYLHIPIDDTCRGIAGTIGYKDPKVKVGNYESMKMQDWWAFGQTAYTLLTKHHLYNKGFYNRLDTTKLDTRKAQDEFIEFIELLENLTDPYKQQEERPDNKQILRALHNI